MAILKKTSRTLAVQEVPVVVGLPLLPWNEGMARTAIQVHAVNLIELGQGKSGSPFRTSRRCKLPTGSPTTNKADCHWWVPKSHRLRLAG